MFPKCEDESIVTTTGEYTLAEGVCLFAKTVRGRPRSGKRALFIHGGGAGGNHSLVERPSRWLIAEGLFDEIIMPDRRGNGLSTPITRKLTMREQAEDMRALLDAMQISGPLTALGISYGGPIALTLAHLDSRVEAVGLVASSPTLKQMSAFTGLLVRLGLIRFMLRAVYVPKLGGVTGEYPSQDAAYDEASAAGMAKVFMESIKRLPKDRAESLLLELESTMDPGNACIPEDVALDVPVLQVIGDRDETWGSEWPAEYAERFPNLRRAIIPGAGHKAVFPRAMEYYQALAGLLREARLSPTAEPSGTYAAVL